MMNPLYLGFLLGIIFVFQANGVLYQPSSAFSNRVARSLHEFSFHLNHEIEKGLSQDKNFVFSPISIFSVLSLIVPGLGGDSQRQVLAALRLEGIPQPSDAEAELCNQVFAPGGNLTLRRANRIFADMGVRILKSFKKTLKSHNNATVKKVMFAAFPQRARRKMNRFASKQTDDEIHDLVSHNSVTHNTKIYLINALALKASWMNSFTSTNLKGKFKVSPHEHVTVPIMTSYDAKCHSVHMYRLKAEIVVLPFVGHELNFVVVMPHIAGNFTHLTNPQSKDIIREQLDRLLVYNGRDMGPCRVEMPKFKVEHGLDDLKTSLKRLGVNDIFSQNHADLSGLTDMEGLYVSDAAHKAVIEVDEKGVKAVAATALGVSARIIPTDVRIDRPFMFFIRHEPTGAVLFMGRVVRPKWPKPKQKPRHVRRHH